MFGSARVQERLCARWRWPSRAKACARAVEVCLVSKQEVRTLRVLMLARRTRWAGWLRCRATARIPCSIRRYTPSLSQEPCLRLAASRYRSRPLLFLFFCFSFSFSFLFGACPVIKRKHSQPHSVPECWKLGASPQTPRFPAGLSPAAGHARLRLRRALFGG